MAVICDPSGITICLGFLVACLLLLLDFVPKLIYVVGFIVIIIIINRGSTSLVTTVFVFIVFTFSIVIWVICLALVYLYFLLV